MQLIDNISYIDTGVEIENVVNTTLKDLQLLKKDIDDIQIKNGQEKNKITIDNLYDEKDIKDRIGYILSYDEDSHLLLGDSGFSILALDEETGKIDIQNSLWINEKNNKEIFFKIKKILGDNYDSFSIADGDRIFSDIGNLRLDLKTGKILFSSDDVEKYEADLNSLGIKDKGVFYDKLFLEDIILNRNKVNKILSMIIQKLPEDTIRQEVEDLKNGKPIVLSIIPSSNKNLASKYNNLDVLMKDYTVLYYQVGSEDEFKSVLSEVQKLKKYGLDIDNFYREDHADKNHIFFTSKGRADEDMISKDDLGEYIKYSDVFEGTNVLMNTCLAGKNGGRKENITDFLAGGLFSKAKKITSPWVEVYGLFKKDIVEKLKKDLFDSFEYYKQNDGSQSGKKIVLRDDEKYIIER